MSWTKLDDGVLTHPKMQEAEELCPVFAWALWTKALVYVNQHKLDGYVTKKIVLRFVPAKHLDAAIRALVTAGLWDETCDGWRFHNFEKHNATKATREHKAKKNADNQAAWRERQRLEREAAAKQSVSTNAPTTYATVSAYENVPKVAPLHSSPVHSTPLPSSPVQAPPADDDGPTEDELFRTYTRAANQASALAMNYGHDDRNALALSTVWGVHGFKSGETKAEFLASLAERVAEYVADAKARGQESKFEAHYAPHKFLQWLNATKAGVDPFPRAPVPFVAGQGGGSQGLRSQEPSKPAPVPPRPDEIAGPDDPNRKAFFELVAGGKG